MAMAAQDELDLNASQNVNMSNSPSTSFQTPPSSHGASALPARTIIPLANAKHLKPFATEDIKVLLLENVNQTGRDILTKQGYQVEVLKSSLPEDQLIEKIRCDPFPHLKLYSPSMAVAGYKTDIVFLTSDVHVIGIRSKTKLTARVLKEARNLIVVGCFCIGTNQVDLQYAAEHGIAVFNSPFSNSRSVAELVIAEIIALARQLGDRSNEMHSGTWNKVSNKCWEIRGKTLGKPSTSFFIVRYDLHRKE